MKNKNLKNKNSKVKKIEMDEATIDGVKLSEVFGDDYAKGKSKADKTKQNAKQFEIDFDPNADVNLKKKKTVWRRIIAAFMWVVIVGISGVGGYVVGDFIIAKIDTYDPNSVAVTELRDSDENINAWRTKGINSLTPAQVFVVAEANLNSCTYYSVTTKGYDGEEKGIVKNSFKDQDVWGYRYRNGDQGYFNYYSTGIIPVINQTRFSFSGDTFTTYNGSLNADGTTTWETEGLERTAQEYEEVMGTLAYYPIDYIVSTRTVISQSSDEKNGTNYSYTISLSPKKSVANYVKKMKTMSGLPDYPNFNSVEIKFVVDSNMNFQTVAIKETYKVNYGMTVTCTGSLRYEFAYKDIKII